MYDFQWQYTSPQVRIKLTALVVLGICFLGGASVVI